MSMMMATMMLLLSPLVRVTTATTAAANDDVIAVAAYRRFYRNTMATKMKFDPRKLMQLAVDVMKQSVSEPRPDDDVPPKVGAVLWKPDGGDSTVGTVETACRGELRDGDHAEFTLLERKNRTSALDGCI